jgi:hypothetical protein
MRKGSVLLVLKYLVIAFMLFAAQSAYADCTGPAGLEGQIMYNSTHKIMQFCDGTDWWSMKETGNGPCATEESGGGGSGGGSPSAPSVADVFSTDLYTGNGSTQTITNGINLSGRGGLVWAKRRNGNHEHGLYDSARGVTKRLSTNNAGAEETDANGLTSFNSDGFTHGSANDIGGNADTYATWTFRKAENFFDVVTYTGDGTADGSRTVTHNLGSVPGMIIVKRLDNTSDWGVYHRSIGNTVGMKLNLNYVLSTEDWWNQTTPTSSVFTLGGGFNDSSVPYVAYLFAHDTSDSGIGHLEKPLPFGVMT